MSLGDNVSLFPGETTEEFDPNVILGAAQRTASQIIFSESTMIEPILIFMAIGFAIFVPLGILIAIS